MVIRGRTRGNGAQLGDYLLANAENESVRVFDIRGTSQPDDVRKSLIEMSLTSELTRSQKGLYHAQINPAYGEDKQMSREDWFKAADMLENELKLTGQKRVIVLHEKKGRIHAHVVWERYDHEKGRMISDSYSRLAQDRARQAMERELEHKKTPERNQRRPEMKKILTDLWKKAATAAEFIREVQAKGYKIARGERRRPFMVVDETGRSFDLARQLEGVRTKEIKERLAFQKLPTEKQAIKSVRAKQNQQTFDEVQERMIDRAANQNQSYEANREEKKLFDEKLDAMKSFGEELTTDEGDEKITESQNKAFIIIKEFKQNETIKEQTKQETEREKRMREFKEQLEQAQQKNRQKSKDRFLEFE